MNGKKARRIRKAAGVEHVRQARGLRCPECRASLKPGEFEGQHREGCKIGVELAKA